MRRYTLTIETEEELHRITFASMFPDALGINMDHDGAVTRHDYVIGRWTWAEEAVTAPILEMPPQEPRSQDRRFICGEDGCQGFYEGQETP